MAERELLEDYVRRGRLTQLATVGADGAPVVCSVWYVPEFRPDRLYFVSRTDRAHSVNIRRTPAVGGAILEDPPAEMGGVGRGVQFTGHAVELPGTGVDGLIGTFVARWPNAARVLGAMPGGASRLYEIAVTNWVLYDEANFRGNPRREIAAI
jgi:uncharacterized protein YhbP (UPF0306 family)